MILHPFKGRLYKLKLVRLYLIACLPMLAHAGDGNLTKGEILYQQKCLMCHQSEGQGASPVYPPLAGSDWMALDRERTIQVLCEGLSGPIVVKGQVFNNTMPAQIINDQEVADVLSYVGQAWGNTMAAFSSAEVSEARKETGHPTYEALLAATAYQPLPKAPEGWALREVAKLPEPCVRFASGGGNESVYILAQSGGIYRLNGSSGTVSQIFMPSQYEMSEAGAITSTGIAVDSEGRLWVVTNQRLGTDSDVKIYMNSVVIWRSGERVDGHLRKMLPWFRTKYPAGQITYNHGVSHMAFGPDGLLYLNSGARTDGGEPGNSAKYHSGGEVDITSCLWRMDPKSDQPKIEVIARGIRNAFGFAWDDHGRLFSISNGPDADSPEELDYIEPRNHYGFPYQFGNKPAAQGTPYPYTPAAPDGLSFKMPIANLGPAGGGTPDAPYFTLEPHSSPGGMIWCGESFPPLLKNRFLLTRFGNMIDCPEDVGFDLISAKMEQKADATWQTRVDTVIAPLARPIDVHALGSGQILILEYTRPTNHKGKIGWLPGRVLELVFNQ